MAYIGNIPAVQYASFSKQTLTADSTTVAFTLDNAVANENELEVFVNNVRQEPGSGKAYTASGTTLTMSAAPTTGDSFYVIFQGKATQTVTPGSGTVTNAMLAGSIDLTSKVTGVLPVANSQKMTPSFSAYRSSAQTISDNTFTKVQFDTEIFDTDSCYDNATNYRFTPTVAGKYFISCYTAGLGAGGNTDIVRHYQALYKNGSQAQLQNLDTRDGGGFRILSINSSYIIDMNGTTDYLEIFVAFDTSGGGNITLTNGSTEHSFFSAYKITGV